MTCTPVIWNLEDLSHCCAYSLWAVLGVTERAGHANILVDCLCTSEANLEDFAASHDAFGLLPVCFGVDEGRVLRM